MRTLAPALLVLAVTCTTAAAQQDSFAQIKKDVQAAGQADDRIDETEFKSLADRLLALKHKGRVGFDVLQYTFWLADVTAAKPETIKSARDRAMEKLLRLYPTTSMMPKIIEQLDEIRRPSDGADLPGYLDRIAAKATSKEIKALCGVTSAGMKMANVATFGISKEDAEKAIKTLDGLESEVGDLTDPRDGKPFKTAIGKLRKMVESQKGFHLGAAAPEIEGTDLDGTAFKLSDYRGKVVMLDFWGDW